MSNTGDLEEQVEMLRQENARLRRALEAARVSLQWLRALPHHYAEEST